LPGTRIWLEEGHVSEIVDNRNQDFSITSHTVVAGDNMFRIAHFYRVAVNDIMRWNNLTNTNLRLGQILQLNLVDEKERLAHLRTHTVVPGDNMHRIAFMYGVSVQEIMRWNNLPNTNLRRDQILFVQDPDKVVPLPTRSTQSDRIEEPVLPLRTEVNEVPTTQVEEPAVPIQISYQVSTHVDIQPVAVVQRVISAIVPTAFSRITSEFGPRWGRHHRGIDFGAPAGTQIKASLPGVVVIAGYHKDFGNRIVLEHENNTQTVYAHNRRNLVSVGDVVEQGQVIAEVGTTGRSTGNHLHFEFRVGSIPKNPRELLTEL
jgi:murein DD-endopeptidase MepM/ murein hydrolase activator NlpD